MGLLAQHASELLAPLLLNLGADFAVAGAALSLGRQGVRSALLTPAQRLFLRPFVSLVVVMTCVSFLSRRRVSWNKLPRLGLQMGRPDRVREVAGD